MFVPCDKRNETNPSEIFSSTQCFANCCAMPCTFNCVNNTPQSGAPETDSLAALVGIWFGSGLPDDTALPAAKIGFTPERTSGATNAASLLAGAKCQHAQQRHGETGIFVRRQIYLVAPVNGDLIIQLHIFCGENSAPIPAKRARSGSSSAMACGIVCASAMRCNNVARSCNAASNATLRAAIRRRFQAVLHHSAACNASSKSNR